MQYLIQRRLKNPNIDNIEKEKLENRLTQINQIDVEKDIALEQACANAPLSANCQTLMKEVKNYEFGYLGTSSQSGNYYGMPVYTRNNLLYGEDANKVAAYSKQYDLLTHLKEKNIQDIAKSYNIDSRYLNYIDSGSQIVGNVLSSVAAVKIGKNQTEYPSSGVSTYHREKVGDVDYPEGMTININWKNHLIKGEGLDQKKGIIGAHNQSEFLKVLKNYDGRITKEISSSIKGVTIIEYEYPKFDGRKNIIGYKSAPSPKTVYDPKIFSNNTILKLGQEAAAKGYMDNLGKKSYNSESGGVPFRIYLDPNTGEVRNVHPR